MAHQVKLLVMDVDGTLTNGQIYMSPEGEWMKSFNIKDGFGIRNLLPRYQVTPVIITGRTSKILESRASELGIQHLYQGVEDKAKCLSEIALKLGVRYDQMACIGDDLNDLPMMALCGINGCPADAVQTVKQKCDYICTTNGGRGAVREFIEWLIKKN